MLTKRWLFLPLLALTACSGGTATLTEAPAVSTAVDAGVALEEPEPPETEWERRRYIDKVARALRNGQGLTATDDLDALLALSREQVIDHFMADPRFEDTALQFSLNFIGARTSSQIRDAQGNLGFGAFNSRRAVNATRGLMTGKSFLSLLALDQPFSTLAPRSPPLPGMFANDTERRAEVMRLALIKADELIALADTQPTATVFCEQFQSSSAVMNLPSDLGLPFEIVGELQVSTDWFGKLFLGCALPDKLPFNAAVAAVEMRKLRPKLPKLLELVEDLAARGKPMVASVTGLVTSSAPGMESLNRTLDQTTFWFALPNSSTNFQRRRAAYILDRFFCDDLKPINAALPETHAQGQHGTDPACRSCHYKLDPMAGFFRDYGLVGFNFAGESSMLFDDLAVMDKATYDASWAGAPGSGRAWNVGYIRSARDESQNAYGQSLEDLFRIIETAPEAKACVVRRTFEFFNGTDQQVDPGYLAYLSTQFTAEAETDSSAAFRALIRRILVSRTFRAVDARSTECYDRAPGTSSQAGPPCAVSFILQANCAQCHNATNALGGLNLGQWGRDPDGRSTFAHAGPQGQLKAEETFTRLLERISTADEKRSMPLARQMPAADRETLYLWLQERLARLGETP
ncbi:MAG: hypothetical protein ACT4TC_11980 [Myxococcaceae bacterium]